MAKSFLHALFTSPEVNHLNLKARSIPIFNPMDKYGRAFLFSWLGYMIAFMSWQAFPPLLTITIRNDLNMTQADVSNSNIVAYLATFLVRLVCGPLCDRFGPRWVYIATLICGCVPVAMAGLVTNSQGLLAVRFFVGILGASFVPSQVYCTAFFDNSVVGLANGIVAGLGNAGGGITYFIMPAVLDSLVNQLGLKPHQAWRVAYVVPFSMIVLVALGMILFCDDSPSGRWCDRHFITKNCEISDCPSPASGSPTMSPSSTMDVSQPALMKQYAVEETTIYAESEHQGRDSQLNRVKAEIIVSPTVRQALRVIVSKESLVLATAYACSLGSEIAINSVLGNFYFLYFPYLGQTGSSRWAAMMGLLNVVFRPLGGFIADVLYKKTKSIWAKKIWLTFVGISFSAFLLAVGFSNPKSHPTMVGLITGYAMFMAASNGANFALVPHVHPFANGIVSGLVGAFGNLGGILFSVVFRYYNSTDLHQSLWIIGAISLAINIATSWVAPIPESQIGGR